MSEHPELLKIHKEVEAKALRGVGLMRRLTTLKSNPIEESIQRNDHYVQNAIKYNIHLDPYKAILLEREGKMFRVNSFMWLPMEPQTIANKI